MFAGDAQCLSSAGAVTYRQTPKPNVTGSALPEQTFTYDSIGRLERTTNLVNNAYTRHIYGSNYVRTFTTVNTVADEAQSLQVFDGVGRPIATAKNHPGSLAGFSGQLTVYDVMGRQIKVSNPTETSVSFPASAGPIDPYSWVASGDDSTWYYTEQTYDWKGRPLRTTHADTKYKEASYSGCGCAGGAVVTITDEGTIDAGVAKRRQQKIYSDVLGRTVKTEILNWQSGSVYSAIVNSYNARDQLTQVRQYAGAEGSGTYQDTTMAYDGYGRLSSRHVPEQNYATATVWTYNADDTVNTVTDARGAVTAYGYAGTNRHLVKSVTHTLIGSPTMSASFEYDAVGNRTAMSDSLGTVDYTYNLLSQLTSETRTFTGLGSFALNYTYNIAGQLTSITDPFGAQVGYGYDTAGRLSAVTGANFASVSTYASNFQYRAWGALKSLSYGNSKTVALGYDVNLNASTYEISGLMKKSYEYYDDGQLKFTQDQLTTNSKFDRLYRYDHVGRITTALSGAEARGQGPTDDRPYNETMTYDEMGHLILRQIRQWDRPDSSGNQPYTNNRRFGWLYDADGRLLSGESIYEYDAAGQTASFGDWDPYVTFQEFDGDGVRTKTVLKNQDPITLQLTSEKTTYFVRSSVLGEVISEVSELGAKERSFVHVAGAVMAVQFDSGGQDVNWEHYDASRGSQRATDVNGALVGSKELDPMGANAGTIKPISWPPPTSSGKLQPYYGVPDLNSAYQGCELSGIPAPCSVVMSSSGNSVLGYSFGGPDGHGTPFFPADWHPGFVGWLVIKQRQMTIDNFMSLEQEWLMSYREDPQLLTGSEIAHLLSNLQKYLGDPDCAKYIETMLGSLPDTVAFTSKFTGSLEDVFNRIKDRGGFWSGNTMAAKSPGLADTNPNTMTTTFDAERIAPRIMGATWQQFSPTNITVHELTHVFTNSPNAGVYGHLQMAKAASDAGSALGLFGKDKLDLEFPDPTKLSGKEYDVALSEYFNRTLSYACRNVKL